jgi:large subunit ribosomal protein L15
MKLDEILHQAGRHKARRRVGRGDGSGHGKTAGRGHKGAGQRSGATRLLGYEGGQNPALARIPKRGFSNAPFRKDYQIVNVAALERLEAGRRVDPAALAAARLIEDPAKPVKILGNGQLTKKLTVAAQRFSASAAEKITQAGGAVEQL